ncbi:MAG: hypothetical protein ACYDG3_10685 [Bacillati bacterium]
MGDYGEAFAGALGKIGGRANTQSNARFAEDPSVPLRVRRSISCGFAARWRFRILALREFV